MEEICSEWLLEIQLSHLQNILESNGFYNLKTIQTLTKEDLTTLGISKLGEKRGLLLAISELQNQPSKSISIPKPISEIKNIKKIEEMETFQIVRGRSARRCGTCHKTPDSNHRKNDEISCVVCEVKQLKDCPTQWKEKHYELIGEDNSEKIETKKN